MPALQVKECPDAVYERLRACAAEENRSIAQQALTIIEDYLAVRESSRDAGLAHTPRSRASYALGLDDRGYASRHRRVLALVNEAAPVPISDTTPRADALLATIREEEAR